MYQIQSRSKLKCNFLMKLMNDKHFWMAQLSPSKHLGPGLQGTSAVT